jgi:hypothetical protein
VCEMSYTTQETPNGLMVLTSQTREENVPVVTTGVMQGTITGASSSGSGTTPGLKRIPANQAVKALLTSDQTLSL